MKAVAPVLRSLRHPVALALGLIVALPARGDDIPACPRIPGVAVRAFPNELPRALRTALAAKLGDIAVPGEAFDATDVVMIGRNRRAIFAWTRGARWVIATEHGGYGYNDPIFAYDVAADGSTATLVAEKDAFPETVCATSRALLDAK